MVSKFVNKPNFSCDDFSAIRRPSFFDVGDLVRNNTELEKYLFKYGLLGDYSGICKICKKGEVKVRFGLHHVVS